MISAAHMLGGSWACCLRKIEKRNATWCVWMFLCILYWAPQTNSFACYMRPHSGSFLSFFAYYMGAPSDQFLRIEYGGPFRSVFFSLIIEASLCLFFFNTIWSDHFFAYFIGAPDHFFVYYIGPPQIRFFPYSMGAPLRSFFFLTIWGPLRSVSSYTIWGGGAHQISFFAYYMEAPRDHFFRLLYEGPLRSVSSLTIWGPH